MKTDSALPLPAQEPTEEQASVRAGRVTAAVLVLAVVVMLCVGGGALAEWLKAGTP